MRTDFQGGDSAAGELAAAVLPASMHLDLHVADAPPGTTQPVPVEPVGSDGLHRLLASPGLVEGVAAGDVVEVTDPTQGHFTVWWRGGNVSIKLIASASVGPAKASPTAALEPLRGVCDGSNDGAAVFTVPAQVGFEAIQAATVDGLASHPEASWHFGNVYDGDDQPLNW